MVMNSRPVAAWMRIMRSWSMTLAMAAIVLFWGFGARLYINPTHVEIVGSQVTVYRSYPLHDWLGLPPPLVSYIESVRPLDTGLPICTDSARFRHVGESGFASWNIAGWAARCMTVSYMWRAEWTPYLFGAIPMPPVRLNTPVFIEVIP